MKTHSNVNFRVSKAYRPSLVLPSTFTKPQSPVAWQISYSRLGAGPDLDTFPLELSKVALHGFLSLSP